MAKLIHKLSEIINVDTNKCSALKYGKERLLLRSISLSFIGKNICKE